jgi:tetratricopeptide (TPR) repeat protein
MRYSFKQYNHEDFPKEAIDIMRQLKGYKMQQELQEKIRIKAIQQQRVRMRTLGIACACACVMAGVSIFYFNLPNHPSKIVAQQSILLPENKPSIEKIINIYLDEAPPSLATQLSIKPTTETTYEAAKKAYQHQEFQEAATQLNKIVATGNANAEHHFYLAMSLMHQPQKEYAQAILQLKRTQQTSNGWKEDETNWYLALLYLKTGNIIEGKQLLNTLRLQQRYNPENVRQLLQVL